MDTKNALMIINDAAKNGALAFVGQGIAEVVPLYKLEATVIDVTVADFHVIQGKFVARKEVCDRIGDAAGISFIAAQCGAKTELREDEFGKRTVFIGFAQGRTRLPDGSWRESSVEEYEFDPYLRAQEDASKPDAKKTVAQYRMDYMKAGRQRSQTGARLRVIRQLTGMPTALEKDKINPNPKIITKLIFSRIIQNTDYILSTPEGKTMAIAMATGAAEMMYGKRQQAQGAPAESPPEEKDPAAGARRVGPEAEGEAPPAGSQPADPFNDFSLESEGPGPGETSRQATIIAALMDWTASGSLAPETSKAIQGLVDRGESNLRTLEPTLALVKLLGEKKLSSSAIDAVRADIDKGVTDPIVLDALLVKAKANAAKLVELLAAKRSA